MNDANLMTDAPYERHDAYDVVIVGGGVAGLAAALTTSRALRTTLVVDAGEQRNLPAHGVHNLLGREGVRPAELVEIGRAEIAAYGGKVIGGTVTSLERREGGEPGAARFDVALADGRRVAARRLLVTTGVVDELPDVAGLAERWGRDLLHCPFCHGREIAGRVVGILATSALGIDQALMWRGWTDRIVLLRHTGPAPSPEQQEKLAARGIEVVEGEVVAVEVDGAEDRLTGVRLADGRVIALEAVVTMSRPVVTGGLLAALGLQTASLDMPGAPGFAEHVHADPTGATTVPGLWLAGNVTAPMAPVLASAASGMTAGSMIVKDLIDDDTDTAVGRHRAAHRPDPARAVLEDTSLSVEQRWDGFYRERGRIWSGQPNAVLAEVAGPLAPGRALDLGCGEGGDAVWLATQGWVTTAVDVAPTALTRTQEAAAEAGVEVSTEQHDLGASLPVGPFDLLSASFLMSPIEWDRDGLLRRAADLLAPGGLLLVVDHGSAPSWSWHGGHDFPSVEELHASIGLSEEQWEVVRLDAPSRAALGPEGQHGEVTDLVVVLRRR